MRIVLLSVLSMLACACGERFYGRVTLTPAVVCPGTRVQVDWSGGTEDSQVFAPGVGLTGMGRRGMGSFVCTLSGDVELITPGHSTRTALVTVVRSSQTFTGDVHVGCGPQPALSGALGLSGTGALMAVGVGGATSTDPFLRLEEVSLDRPGLVFHEAAMARVETVPVPFTGVLPGGYTVVAPLLEGEVCPGAGVVLGPDERLAPGHLTVTVTAGCI